MLPHALKCAPNIEKLGLEFSQESTSALIMSQLQYEQAQLLDLEAQVLAVERPQMVPLVPEGVVEVGHDQA